MLEKTLSLQVNDARTAKRLALREINRRFTQILFLMPCGHVFGQTGRKTISVHLYKDLNLTIVRDGVSFVCRHLPTNQMLVSELCALCVSAVKYPNPHLR